jgi:sugar phosphate isomerase/epimerase
MEFGRKDFLKQLAIISAGGAFYGKAAHFLNSSLTAPDMFFDISLAEWSLNESLFDGEITNMEFPEITKNKFGIEAVEYVNQFFADKAEDKKYLDELNQRCDDLGVEQVLIMIDGEGALAATDEKARKEAVENHYKWVEAAEHLGCHSIRVNAQGDGDTPEEQHKAAVEGLGSLSTFATDYDINIIVENHGGYSSNAEWLAGVMKEVNMDNCGTLPDFGNFCIERSSDGCANEYDRYKGTEELMPYAKGVSAKSHNFNEQGEETSTSFEKMLTIVKDSGYSGHVGIEYEGSEMSPDDGIMATKKLLETVGSKMS